MLLGQLSICHLKDIASGLWNAPVPCDRPRFHFVEIVGTIKNYHVLLVVFISPPNHGLGLIQSQSCLILKDPKEKSLLSKIYNGQQQRLQAIVNDLTEIEKLSEVSIHRSLYLLFFQH
jgi:hypothetical protein